MNQTIIHHLTELVEQIKREEEPKWKFKVKQYNNAIKKIKQYPKTIESGKEARENIEGIGEGISKRIDELIKTGKIQELKEKPIEQVICEELERIHGIGPKQSKRLQEDGITGIEDLQQKIEQGYKIDETIKKCIKYTYELEQRIPRKEIEEIDLLLRRLLIRTGLPLEHTICGSYRRGQPTSGDIDVLITNKEGTTLDHPLETLVTLLTSIGLIREHITEHGSTKYMGICKHVSSSYNRRIDIRYVPREEYSSAILYFTGSDELNKEMRLIAKRQGYTLNEYGLYNMNGVAERLDTEESIFTKLGMRYLPPTERNK